MTLGFTLIGAYRADARTLDFRRLEVAIRLHLSPLALGPPRLHARVHAEELADAAEARGEMRVSRSSIHYALFFASDEGGQVTLHCSHDLSRLTSRSLTEFRGELIRLPDESRIGPACLRFDVRRALGL